MTGRPAEDRRALLAAVQRGDVDVAEAVSRLRALGTAGSTAVPSWYEPWWEEPAPPLAPAAPSPGGPTVLVLDGPLPPGATADGLVLVRAGDRPARRPDGSHELRFDRADDWADLWAGLTAAGTPPARAVVAGPPPDRPLDRALDVAQPLLASLIAGRPVPAVPVRCLVPGPPSAAAAALGALCQVAAEEDGRLNAACVSATAPDASGPDLVALAVADCGLPAPGLGQVHYDRGRRRRLLLRPVHPPQAGPSPFRHGGVYLLAGGGGGIGSALAELLAERYAARLLLLTRSRSAALRATADRVARAGGEARPVTVDLTRYDEVLAAVAEARRHLGPISGVLHLAGVNRDAYLVNKTTTTTRQVLAAKLLAAQHLDRATAGEPLEVFLSFSSVAGYLGGPGQADYAAANRALGVLAAERAERVRAGRAAGTTVSVAWPAWAAGGMRPDPARAEAMRVLQGLLPMPTEDGWRAFAAASALGRPDLLLGHGDAERLAAHVRQRTADRRPGTPASAAPPGPAGPAGPPGAASPASPAGPALPVLEGALAELVRRVAKLPPDGLQVDQELSTLGIDSVLVRRLTVELEARLGPLPATLLFEHRTVRSLAAHLLGTHADAADRLAAAAPGGPAADPVRSVAAPRAVPGPGPAEPPRVPPAGDPVAVIGLAGRYPGARDLDELWDVLVAGRECVTEVPAGRWDHGRIYEPDGHGPGSTYGRWGGFLDGVDRFDARFFGISPREATRTDPAERLFLEVAWTAMEDAGYSRRLLHRLARDGGGRHAVGVFVGLTGSSYELIGAEEWGKGSPVSAYSMDYSVANRLSYLLDLHGPSLVVDSACSSSLTALHLACESLRRGESRLAFAGGVCLNLHPYKYGALAELRMLSTDGRCRAFGAGGDGFVPAEGVGAVLLKPLSTALADGDPIRAVILGTAVNHGGKTNGYTVPTPVAHAALVADALERSGVDARTVSYVEAHGTGTALGDPIEIEGLARAFGRDTEDRGFCAIGSVKSNLGHAESAAGVAGLTKVVLQLQKRTLVPTLHCDELNPAIDFAATPFVPQRRLSSWETPPADRRRAGLSSFGAGGANAHVLVEEAPELAPAPPDTGDEHFVALSARTADQLRDAVARLRGWLRASDRAVAGLPELAYTLLVGREHWEHRLAVPARSEEELADRLDAWLAGSTAAGSVAGTVSPGAPAPPVGPEQVRELQATGGWAELARRWAAGAEVAWDAAFRPGRRRVALPGYPFSGDRYWVRTSPPRPAPAGAGRRFQAASVEVTVRRDDPAVADHEVGGRPVVAGVLQLELVGSAAESLGLGPVRSFTGVRWRVPLEVTGDTLAVSVELTAAGADVDYRVLVGRTVHSAGRLSLGEAAAEPAPARVDPRQLLDRRPRRLAGAEVYAAAERLGLRYGESYRRVRQLWWLDGEALAEVAPVEGAAPVPAGLVDAGLHTVHGLAAAAGLDGTPLLPAAAGRVERLGPASAVRLAHARVRTADPAGGRLRCDVVLADAAGHPVLAVHDLLVVRPSGPAGQPAAPPAPAAAAAAAGGDAAAAGGGDAEAGVSYHRARWRPVPPAGEERQSSEDGRRVLVVGAGRDDYGLAAALVARYGPDGARRLDPDTVSPAGLDDVLAASGPFGDVYFLGGVQRGRYPADDLDLLADCQRRGVTALFHLVQGLARRRPGPSRLRVVTGDVQQVDPGHPAGHPFAAALPGLAATVPLELPWLPTSCVDLAGADLEAARVSGWDRLLDRLAREPTGVPVTPVALRGEARLELSVEPVELPDPDPADLPLRRGGRYLILGGAGGLGRAVTRYLLAEHDARVVLVGRRPVHDLPAAAADLLAGAPGQVGYAAADGTDPVALERVVAGMRDRFGGVDGVVHSAFVLADRTLVLADEATLAAPAGPKVFGTVALQRALAAEPLDFLALFSSAIAHSPAPGQAGYAAASTFQDAYGRYLAARLGRRVHVLNWGYWGESGSVATAEHARRLARRGIAPLSDAEGVAAFRRVLASGAGQVTPIKTTRSRGTPLGRFERAPAPSVLSAVAARTRAAAADLPAVPGPDQVAAVEALARRLVLRALRDAGALPATGSADLGAVRAGLAVLPGRRRLLDALLNGLVRGGLLDRAGERVTVRPADPGAGTAVDAFADRVLAGDPRGGPLVDLLTTCAAALPEVLAGRRRGLEVLFPGGSQDVLAPIYRDDPRAEHLNELCAHAAEAYVLERLEQRPDRPVQLIEVGAGTGGTTGPVLRRLAAYGDRVRYLCTDVSPALVRTTGERLAPAAPALRTAVLDVTADPDRQGLAGQRFDVVLASNVLHATPDVRAAVRTVARLLRPGGLLVLNEATRVLDSVTLIFGLTDGWWLYEDPALRLPDGPLLGVDQWRAVLVEAGLVGVRPLGLPGHPPADSGQHLLLAERDGWRELPPPPPPQAAAPPDGKAAPVAAVGPVEPGSAAEAAPDARAAGDRDDLLDHLRAAFAHALRMDPAELEPAVPLADYGTDSLIAMEVAERLEPTIGPVPVASLLGGGSLLEVAAALAGPPGAARPSPEPVVPVVTSSSGAPRTTPSSGADRSGRSEPPDGPDSPEPGPGSAHRPEGAGATPGGIDAGPWPARPATRPDPGPAAAVAVVGLAGRYPGASDVRELWANLRAGRRAIGPVPPSRWSPSPDDPADQRWGGFLDGVDEFDSLFFRIPPRTAQQMDPQERLFLQAAWTALEDAGLPPGRLRRELPTSAGGLPVGVFVGVMHSPYQLLAADRWAHGVRTAAGSAPWSVANRVSHVLGLTGPSMAVDSACSSSLTAIHLACASLRAGECAAALVGGVNLILHPSHHHALSTARMLAADGRGRPFAATASGMVTGEGIGVAVLRPLADALRAGDRVYAVVLGSAVNADGRTDAYAVPGRAAETEVVRRALQAAGLRPDDLSYLEAQATGSTVGDAVELAALGEAFGRAAPAGACRLGSVKANLGHLESAAGIVQLTKVALQLWNEELVPTPDSAPPHARLLDPGSPFRLVDEPTPWPASTGRRYAGISSFGAGGANAHVVLGGAALARDDRRADDGRVQVVPLSARRPAELREQAARLRAALTGGAGWAIRDVAYTLQLGREPMAERTALLARDVRELGELLDRVAERGPDPGSVLAAPGPPAAATEEAGRLATAWVEGSDVDWQAQREGGDRRLLPLPGYPFARDRHWLPEPAPPPGPAAEPAPAPVPGPGPEPGSAPAPVPGSAPAPGPVDPPAPQPAPAPPAGVRPADRERVLDTVVRTIGEVLSVPVGEIGPGDHLSDFGFDSVTVLELADRLTRSLGRPVDAPALYGYRDVTKLVDALAAAPVAPVQPPQLTPAPVLAAPTTPAPPERATGAPGPVAAPPPPPPPPPVATPGTVSAAADTPAPAPVAVIGMAGRFPGSPDLAAFWTNLVADRDLVAEVAPGRLAGPTEGAALGRAGLIDGIDLFDADFFQISPREARLMDPQQRLFLQVAWHAVEDAGYDPTSLAGSRTGVFAGVAGTDYARLLLAAGVEPDGHLVAGTDHSVLTSRLSFLLDLHGPSEPIDTACSSSLVAVARAVRAIQDGDCELALAGGVNVILTPEATMAFGRSGMLAADGRCKTFDARADGYVRGEGVGVVLLKALDRAVADGDHVYAVVRGGAVNHGGRATSLTAPNPTAQAQVVAAAQRRAGVTPDSVSYVETHGTGTKLGDPVEITGLRSAFGGGGGGAGGGGAEPARCGLGSVKSHVGHLETAAGICGLIATVLALRHRLLPPVGHFRRLNPHLDLDGSPFYVVDSVRPWDPPADRDGRPLPRRAGVSSFGYSGVNAHVVVEEWVTPPGPAAPRDAAAAQVFVLSARDDTRLAEYARRLLDRLEDYRHQGGPAPDPADVAYTLQVGRPALPVRLAVVAAGLGQLVDGLRAYLAGEPNPAVRGSARLPAEGGPAGDTGPAGDGEPAPLAAAWVRGLAVDWAGLHRSRRRRVPLPAYPFAPTRHWLPEPDHRSVPAAADGAPAHAHPGPHREPEAVPPARPGGGDRPAAVEPVGPPPRPEVAPAAGDLDAQRSELYRHVRDAVAGGIGVPAGEVDPDRDLASYGVDSIGALRIMQRVQARYGDDVPVAALFEHSTLNRLVGYLADHHLVPVGPGPAPAPEVLPTAAMEVVELAPGAGGPPWYGLPGETGELTWLLRLRGALAADGPVHGVEGIAAGSVPERAAAVAEAILAHHPGGPCRLVGHGLATHVAVEVARHLLDAGCEVVELLLVAPPELSARPDRDHLAAVVATAAAVWGAGRPPAAWADPEQAARWLRGSSRPPVPDTALPGWLTAASERRRELADAVAAHLPRPLAGVGRTVLVVAEEGSGAAGWDRLVVPPPVVRAVPGPSAALVGGAAAGRVATCRAGGESRPVPARPPAEDGPLVAVNRHGAHAPSFWAHHMYGDVSYCVTLSRFLGPRYPVFGLEQLDADARTREFPDLETMCAGYVAAILREQPDGPYRIGGCSFGGVAAFEIVRQLLAAGKPVGRLCVIDAIMPGTDSWFGVDWSALSEEQSADVPLMFLANAFCQRWGVAARVELADLAGLPPAAQYDLVARRVVAGSPATLSEPELRRLVAANHELLLHNSDLLVRYRPQPLARPVPTVLFRGTRGFSGTGNPFGLPRMDRRDDDRTNGFGAFVGDRITVHDIDADHFTILGEASLRTVAGLLAPSLAVLSDPPGPTGPASR